MRLNRANRRGHGLTIPAGGGVRIVAFSGNRRAAPRLWLRPQAAEFDPTVLASQSQPVAVQRDSKA